MPNFYVLTALMALLAMVFVVLPLMVGRSGQAKKRNQINVQMFKEQLAALDGELAAGRCSEPEYRKLRTELERRLLADTGGDSKQQQGSAGIASRVLLALLIPPLAYFVYSQVGAAADWRISETLDNLSQVNNEIERKQTLQQLASQLDQRLDRRDSAEYYMLLARTQLELGNYPASADAYRRLLVLVGEDASVLGQYAQALYLAAGRKMTPEVKRVAEQALAINPQQATVLGMLGIDSFENADYQAAANYWQQLLPSLAPGTPNEQMIRQGINQARELAGLAPLAAASTAAAADSSASLQVAVSLSEQLTADPATQVFVFARAVSGPPMPLAVARLTVADLPVTVTLDDSMAMTPALKLSSFEQVEVVARISLRGIANRGSGDMEGAFGPVSPAEQTQVSVQIDKVLQ